MKFIDLFAGVGGFRLGLKKANQAGELVHPRGDPEGQEAPVHGRSPEAEKGDDAPSDGGGEVFRCVWSCEVDKWCRAVYKYHWGETPAGDARQVRPDDIPDFDLLCAGFPCQSFSVAGKRKGFGDSRGTLFYEICRIARAKRPKMLLLENVAGLLSVDRGETFGAVLQELGDIGYGVEWQVLNSKDHGVPQNRERVFIVGHLGGLPEQTVFPVGEGDGGSAEGDAEATSGQVANALSKESAGGQNARGNYIAEGKPVMAQLPMVIPAPIRFLNRNQRNFDPDTAMTVDTARSTGVAILDEKYFYTKKELETIRQKKAAHPWIRWKSGIKGEGAVPFPDDPSKPARTVTTQEGKPNRMTHGIPSGVRIRRLTPRECERLQGFPDDWTRWGRFKEGDIVWNGEMVKLPDCVDEDGILQTNRQRPKMTKAKKDGVYPVTDPNRYRMMGNAVTVNVVEFIARRLPT
ncbi:MAG: DNA cytosine methyltransferase [Methanobacteriota archaeon]